MEEDLDAIERIRSGEIQAYAILVRKYQTRVRGYCLGALGRAAEADDAAQEIFFKAYRGLGGFRGKARFSTWLYRISVNHCRDLLRSSARGRTESWEALQEREGESAEARIAVMPPPPAGELERQVKEALDRLPEPYKAVLLLREVQQLSYAQLAETLDCSMDAVKARLRRARRELAARVKGGVGYEQ